MNSLSDFIDVIKRIALDAVEASKPVKVCFGTVKSTDPLKIFVDQKMLLDETRLVLTRNVIGYDTTMTTGWSVSSGDVAAYATSFVGKIPYYYGAGRNYSTLEDIVAANGKCDCSAFTERVFRHFGAEIGSTTYEQQNKGTSVDRANIESGDLLLFNNHSSGAQPGHVGIYIGDGQVVHEGGGNNTGNVKINPLSSFTVMSIRRFNIKNTNTKVTYSDFPKYVLSQKTINELATVITGETGGEDVVAARQEASQMVNLNEVYYGRSNTESNIKKTVKRVSQGGWYSDDSWNRGCTQTAIEAVQFVMVEGKRTLPRYVVEHDTFPNDILSSKSRSSYSKGDSVSNIYGSNYKFYCFFGSDGKGDIAGYFPKDYEKYKSDIPWANGANGFSSVTRNDNITVNNGLVVGDKVVILRMQGGQKFIVWDRVAE